MLTNTKVRYGLIILAVIGLGVIGVMALQQSSGAREPESGDAQAAAGTGPAQTEATPSAPAAAATGAAVSTTEEATAAGEATPPPKPTMTKEEKALVAEWQEHSVQSASSPNECGAILETEPWCSVAKSARRVTQPEWETLFPQTEFFVIEQDLYGGELGPEQHNVLIIEQNGQRFTTKSFARLLRLNDIVITEENRELVARAFVLMHLPNYLEEEIVFLSWREGEWPSPLDIPFNYRLVVWTKIQGLRINWFFLFHESQLAMARGVIGAVGEGDYIKTDRIPHPTKENMEYKSWIR